jgi:hypothetical protein
MYDKDGKFALGNVPSPEWNALLQKNNVKNCKNYKQSDEESLKEAKKIFLYYKSKGLLPNELSFEYEHLDEITKQRYVIIADTLKFVMTQPNVPDFMKEMYYLSQKMVKTASPYIKIY